MLHSFGVGTDPLQFPEGEDGTRAQMAGSWLLVLLVKLYIPNVKSLPQRKNSWVLVITSVSTVLYAINLYTDRSVLVV